MLESFFGSLVDGRTLHASVVHETHRSDDDALSLDLAAGTYKLIERASEFGRRIAAALHPDHGSARPLGCG